MMMMMMMMIVRMMIFFIGVLLYWPRSVEILIAFSLCSNFKVERKKHHKIGFIFTKINVYHFKPESVRPSFLSFFFFFFLFFFVFKCGSLRTFGPRNNAGTVATSTLLNSISTRYFFFSFLRFFFSVIYNSF